MGTITEQRLLPPLVVTSPYMDNSVDSLPVPFCGDCLRCTKTVRRISKIVGRTAKLEIALNVAYGVRKKRMVASLTIVGEFFLFFGA